MGNSVIIVTSQYLLMFVCMWWYIFASSMCVPRHKNRGKLSDLVAEHLDHLHYLNDILIINCEFLNDVLTDHLLNRLFLPLYVYSLVSPETVRSPHW